MASVLSTDAQLAEYVKQAGALATEAALTALLTHVMSAPDVFVFGELLALDAVQKVCLFMSRKGDIEACGERGSAHEAARLALAPVYAHTLSCSILHFYESK